MTNDEGLEPYETFKFRGTMSQILGMYFDVPKMKDHAEFLQNKIVAEKKCNEALKMFNELFADRARLQKLLITPKEAQTMEERSLLFYPEITFK